STTTSTARRKARPCPLDRRRSTPGRTRQTESRKQMAQTEIALDGLLAFPLTPFTENLELNLDALAENVESHIAAGAGALFVACGTGELSSLSPGEHAAVLAKARGVSAGRVPVWVGAGGGASSARAGVAAAKAGGADGVLLLPPYLVSG